ncbi:MAG: hypothetical protein U0359_29295 [Byssovorax sp.]
MRSHLPCIIASLLGLPLLSAGCGGGGSTGTGGGGGAETGDITGKVIDTYRPSSGEVQKPSPGSWVAIEALVPAGDGYTAFAGTISAAGDISIPGVPEGPYLLSLTNPLPSTLASGQLSKSFYGTSSRTLDLGAIYSGRPDIASMTEPTHLVLDATLQIPWQAYTLDGQGNVTQPLDDDVQFVSRNASVTGLFTATQSDTGDHPPADGDSSLSAWSIDARSGFDDLGILSLVDGSKGDDFAVLHDVAAQVGMADDVDPWKGYAFTSTQEVWRPPGFTMKDGGTSVLSGEFTKVPQKSFALDYKGSAFNALFADLAVDNVNLDIGLYLEAGTPEPAVGAYPTLLGLNVNSLTVYQNPACAGPGCNEAGCPSGCDLGTLWPPGDHAHTFSYGNPFDFGQELVAMTLFFQKSVTTLLPEMTNENLNGLFTVQAPASELDGKPLAPTLGLPKDITVGGKSTPYDQVTAGVGTAPLVHWSAPSLGTPTHYRVNVIDLTDLTLKDGSTLRRRSVAVLNLTGTEVRLPDGILKTGRFYYMQVTAVAADKDDLSRPFYFPVHDVRATMFTGVITP